ncbi:ATP-dependent RNA helicase [Skeletonema marinoi]|uniref:RNA helicase n=1 Tax=Skeletonema marinoi TaxID=267567 RepID=A0AAD8XXG1_9STRA|nr:ATP-dependent RNA helicase [Skeletonema marinoi]
MMSRVIAASCRAETRLQRKVFSDSAVSSLSKCRPAHVSLSTLVSSSFSSTKSTSTSSWTRSNDALSTRLSQVVPSYYPIPTINERYNISSSMHFHSTPTYLMGISKTARRRRNMKKRKQKEAYAADENYQHEVYGENGRPILTAERMQNEVLELSSFASLLPQGVEKQAKGFVHNAQVKMLFQQRYEHFVRGPTHDALFYATLHTIVDKSCFDGIPDFSSCIESNNLIISSDGTTVEFINTGAARLKKQAETLAAADFVVQLAELNIDIRHPPDLAGIRKTQEEELFKADMQRAQMILEVLNVSRPRFDTSEHPDGWVSRIKFYCRGVPIDTKAAFGRSKAEAEGRALLSTTEAEGPLEYFIGQQKMNDIKASIDESPAGHVAGLHVPELPEEALDRLMNAIGSHTDHTRRLEEHALAKKRYEVDFKERRLRKQLQQDGRMKRRRNEVPPNNVEMGENDTFLKEEQSRAEKAASDPEGKQGKMKSVRDALPIKAIQDNLIEALKSQQVVVVSGGTGSVAERIAAERDEEIGHSVGYNVRFNKKSPRESASVEFVTTGILLRRLVNDSFLDGISHVMIDEVHERDINTDFLLILLRELLEKRPDLRVILMSATLDAESFGKYFSSGNGEAVPVMSVPTKPRHPVEIMHLEEMEKLPNHVRDLSQSLLRLHDQQLQLELEVALSEEKAAMKLAARSDAEDQSKNLSESSSSSDSDDSDDDDDVDDNNADFGLQSYSPRLKALNDAVSMRGGNIDGTTSNRQHRFSDKREIGEITTKLLANLAQHVAQEETCAGRKGSILCFLPGLDEIKEATEILQKESDRALKACMNIIPLHSTIPQDEQQKVFIPAAEGTVKVILATNIAESSVTIDDVIAVIDGGLCREMNWSAERAMSEMVTVPTSKASATQRLGRAGRVAPGKCYRLYSKGQHHAMLERPQPEIQRTALEATCLNTINMTDKGVEAFLSCAMDPPSHSDVALAMERLRKLGAVTTGGSNEALTPLGKCLARLPLDPAMAKMLIMGTVLQCLDPVLTASACSSSRELFYTPLGMRKEQHSVKKSFSKLSDTMASVEAYDEFQYILNEHGWSGAREWAAANFVSIHALNSVSSVRWQLINELQSLGLVPQSDLIKSRGKKREFRHDASINRNAAVDSLVSAVWAAGVPDNLAARRQLGNFGTLRSKTENHAGLHPSSVAFHRKPPKERKVNLPLWFFYREMVLSSQVFLRGCTALEPEQVLLFGGYGLETSESDDGRRRRVLDDWIIVEGRCSDTLDALSRARSEIDVALDTKIMNPRRPLPESQQTIIDAVCDCFTVIDDDDADYDSESDYYS